MVGWNGSSRHPSFGLSCGQGCAGRTCTSAASSCRQLRCCSRSMLGRVLQFACSAACKHARQPPWQLHYVKSLLRNASVWMQAEGWTPFGAAPFCSPERCEGASVGCCLGAGRVVGWAACSCRGFELVCMWSISQLGAARKAHLVGVWPHAAADVRADLGYMKLCLAKRARCGASCTVDPRTRSALQGCCEPSDVGSCVVSWSCGCGGCLEGARVMRMRACLHRVMRMCTCFAQVQCVLCVDRGQALRVCALCVWIQGRRWRVSARCLQEVSTHTSRETKAWQPPCLCGGGCCGGTVAGCSTLLCVCMFEERSGRSSCCTCRRHLRPSAKVQ